MCVLCVPACCGSDRVGAGGEGPVEGWSQELQEQVRGLVVGWPAVVTLTCRLLARSLACARVASRTGKTPLDVAVGAGVKKLLEE